MADTIFITEAQSMSLSFSWLDADGQPVDLALGAVTLFDASNPAMNDMVLTKAGGNVVTGLMASASVAQLRNGRATNFRLKVTFPSLEVLTTPPIWVQVI